MVTTLPGLICRKVILCVLAGSMLSSCAVQRRRIPLGEIPRAKPVSQQDVEYGQNVLAQLTQQYPLSENDKDIVRVRDLVEKLSEAAGATYDPWHPYVLEADNIVNAGATRGNFIFVWTGMLRVIENDHELAAILAHEIGHVLAGHTQANPQEEANKMISQVAGVAAREVLRAQSAAAGQFGQLAQVLLSNAVKGFIVNPETQRQELEADQIGLFLLADAGFDPAKAVNFWKRVQDDPRFGANSLEFFSSHPTSKTRLEKLNAILHNAQARYRNRRSGPKAKTNNQWTMAKAAEPKRKAAEKDKLQPWVVDREPAPVYKLPEEDGKPIRSLEPNSKVAVLCHFPEYLRIVRPIRGFVPKKSLLPLDKESLQIRKCKTVK